MTKILAVDDQKVIRDLVTHVLTQEGYEVETAGNSEEALQKAQRGSFDMIISDINMPGGSGIILVSKLRELERYKFVPILMMTTESAQYRKDKAKAVGASGWLTKPFDPPRLLTATRRLLEKA